MPTPSRWPLRVGIVGYGFAGRTFHAPLIDATPGLALVAISSGQRALVAQDWPQVQVVDTPDALFALPDLDMVVIASPNETHAPLARAALHAGLHVVVDKPFTLDLAQARALADEAQGCSRILSVFQNRRWDSDFLAIRNGLNAGMIGRVATFESRMDRFRPQVRDRWREADMPGSGLWFDLGPHLADQALQLFGLPDSIQATLACQRDDASIDDWAQVILLYGQMRVSLHCSMLAAWPGARFAVHGTGGTLLKRAADQQETQLRTGMVPGADGWGADPDDMLVFDGTDTPRAVPSPPGDQRIYYALLRDAVMGYRANPVPPIQAIAVMAVLETAARSARDGKRLSLPLNEEEKALWAQAWER